MNDPSARIKDLQPENKYFIGIDSDGCVFDSMELKHKECFCPAFIRFFGLQAVSKYARETWDFVNLYSRTRGTNRFKALVLTMDLLFQRPEVKKRIQPDPDIDYIRDWVSGAEQLSNPSLEKELSANPANTLRTALEWSYSVNDAIQQMVCNLPPFPLVKESLQIATKKADMIVVSQTPVEVLEREWKENAMTRYVRLIAGQEFGAKSRHLELAAGGKYDEEHILMIGDSPGDLAAAHNNNALFFPVVPSKEELSWNNFHNEGLDRFFKGTFKGSYQQGLLSDFEAHLPSTPPWQQEAKH